MQELEKILEEIDNLRGLVGGEDNYINMYVKKTWGDCLDMVQDIIRKHMNDGWIPAEERLPEVDEDTEETIEDDDCPEYLVTIRGASESTVLKYSPDGAWFDENGYVYDVIAWRPLPEPYQAERSET